jgi:hypothetical protein
MISQRAPFFFVLQHSANGPYHEGAVDNALCREEKLCK